MPILLTKPFSVGDLDPDAGEGYKFCQLTGLYHNGLTMAVTLEWQFGTASGNYYEVWQRGAGSPTKSCEVPGQVVVPLWSQKPQDGESVGQAIRRVTYEYLIGQGYVAGTIVNNPPLPPAPAEAEAASEASEGSSSSAPAQGDDTPAAQPDAAETTTPASSGSETTGSSSDAATEPTADSSTGSTEGSKDASSDESAEPASASTAG